MSSIPPLKRCSKCGVDKPLDQFHKNKATDDGLAYRCKPCIKAYQQEWRNDPRYTDAIKGREKARNQDEERREQQRVYSRKAYHSEQAKAKRQEETERNRMARRQVRQSRLSDPAYQEEQRRKKRAWKGSDKALAQRRKQRAERYQNDPEHRRRLLQQQRDRLPRYTETLKRQRAKHTERYNTDPAYRKRYNARINVSNHKRHSILRNAGSHTPEEWDQLCARYDHRCLCCGEEKPLTKDHIMPLSKGGVNTIDNLQPLCMTCNVRKHARHIDYRQAEGDT